MAVVAVVGGTGTVGRLIVQGLREGGADPRVLSRRSEAHPVDLTTGAGLEDALRGARSSSTRATARRGGPSRYWWRAPAA